MWVTVLGSIIPGWVTTLLIRVIGRLEYAYSKDSKQNK